MTPTQQSAALSSKPPSRPDNPVSYPVTRDDLLVLARHHAQTVLDLLIWYFYTGQVGMSDVRERWASEDELTRLEEVLGAESIAAIQAEVEASARRKMGRTHWHLFRNGAQVDLDKILNEMNDRMVSVDKKMADQKLKDRALGHLHVEPSGVFRDDGDLWSLAEPYDDEAPRLILALTTLRGGMAYDSESRVERPAEWFAPYGLGRW